MVFNPLSCWALESRDNYSGCRSGKGLLPVSICIWKWCLEGTWELTLTLRSLDDNLAKVGTFNLPKLPKPNPFLDLSSGIIPPSLVRCGPNLHCKLHRDLWYCRDNLNKSSYQGPDWRPQPLIKKATFEFDSGEEVLATLVYEKLEKIVPVGACWTMKLMTAPYIKLNLVEPMSQRREQNYHLETTRTSGSKEPILIPPAFQLPLRWRGLEFSSTGFDLEPESHFY